MKTNYFFAIAILFVLTITGCTKKQDPGPGNNKTTITYSNQASTPINITVNGQTQTIAVGSNVQYSGTYGQTVTGSAITSGHTAQGNIVGGVVSWAISNSFPATGNSNVPLFVDASLFFLKIQNKSGQPINGVYVNYQLINQTLDNVSVPNDSQIYNIGYYKAFTNSNVRAINGNTYWLWPSLPLTFSQNQVVALIAN